MTAIFNFQSLLVVILLVICTCAYVHATAPALLDRNKHGFPGLLWKAARVGERLSPWVSLACIGMGVSLLFFTGASCVVYAVIGVLAVFPILVFGINSEVFGKKAYIISSVAFFLCIIGLFNTFCVSSPLLSWTEAILCVVLGSLGSLAWINACSKSCHEQKIAIVLTSISWCALGIVCFLKLCAIALLWINRHRPAPPIMLPRAMLHA